MRFNLRGCEELPRIRYPFSLTTKDALNYYSHAKAAFPRLAHNLIKTSALSLALSRRAAPHSTFGFWVPPHLPSYIQGLSVRSKTPHGIVPCQPYGIEPRFNVNHLRPIFRNTPPKLYRRYSIKPKKLIRLVIETSLPQPVVLIDTDAKPKNHLM